MILLKEGFEKEPEDIKEWVRESRLTPVEKGPASKVLGTEKDSAPKTVEERTKDVLALQR